MRHSGIIMNHFLRSPTCQQLEGSHHSPNPIHSAC
uniref:Uncharacterized protein n=1 Tax=Arundo donax TaxID=35708 RepID=A0A0A8YV87_ARUDO